MDELEAIQVNEGDSGAKTKDYKLFHGPMAVITQGGNELMYSYNNVTQNLLKKVCLLHEQLTEKEQELIKLTSENERLLERIHELLIGAELREEARENDARKHFESLMNRNMSINVFENKKKKSQLRRKNPLSYYTSFAKITALLGLTVGATVYMKSELEI